ncbi:hypothetical protein CP061683_1192A, partial [Chlamydia psittaci 06-1683]
MFLPKISSNQGNILLRILARRYRSSV